MQKKYYRPVMLSLASIGFLLCLYLTSLYSYILFYSTAGIFTVIAAALLFLITWISKKHLENNYWILIGIAYLFIGGLYFLHTLSYNGMQIFRDYNFYGNQVWIALRYIESITLLAAFFYLNKKIKSHLTILIYSLISASVILSIFIFKIFPICFTEGKGPTLFNAASEYIITFILFSGIILLIKNKQKFEEKIYRYLFWSYILNVFCEFSMFPYVSGFYISALIGPCIKIFSIYFMLRAMIEVGILKPYSVVVRELKRKQIQLEEISLVDEFTGVFNRRAAFNTLEKLIKLLKRNKQSLSVCYIGLDNLNKVIDYYGQEEGNIMVNLLTNALKESTRQSDYICRLDEDEFLLILPECGTDSACIIIERVRESLHVLNNSIDKPYNIDFSYGFASYNYNNTFDIDSFLRIADYNMYQNKIMKTAAAETNIY